MLLALLICCNSVSAQTLLFSKDSAIVKEIDLPSVEPFDTSRSYFRVNTPHVYIISDKDVYDLFGYDILMKYYQFNFADYHILGEQKCIQCAKYCRHNEGDTYCHRNRCNKTWKWVIRDNKKAFTEIPSHGEPWYKRDDLPRYRDTVITERDSSKWYTTGHGDCFAKFKYAVVADKYHPVLILKEWNYWGGCRAGGSKPATIVYKEPGGILQKTKRTILVKGDPVEF